MEINERLFEIMKRKKITQSALAEKLNIKQSTIAHWKGRGSKIPVELLPQICNILEVSPNTLINGSDNDTQLTQNEIMLLKQFRNSNSKDQVKLLKASKLCASRAKVNRGIDTGEMKNIKALLKSPRHPNR